ncbi:MAG: glutathione S-transferase [Solirubrobacteraceae bacterium]|nr:glutathione S-transferase [Solirubrobacteraceae bacterium]
MPADHKAKLYVVPGSHPSMAGRLMLEHKGIPYRRVDLLAAIHKPILRLLGFRETTVPALRIDGRRLQDTVKISRALDELQPDPPLFPPVDDPARPAVEAAEHWGEAVLQDVPRRLSWWALTRDREPIRSFSEGFRLHVPLGLAIRTAGPILWAEVKINGATDDAVREDLAALPALLQQADDWLRDGTLGREPATAADYQVATSVRLLMCFEDLNGAIPAALKTWADTLVPDFPGRVPHVFPAEWLSGLPAPATDGTR